MTKKIPPPWPPEGCPELAQRSAYYWGSLEVSKREKPPFTRELHEKMVRLLVERTLTFEAAASQCAVSRGQLYAWVERGRAGQEPYQTWLADMTILQGWREGLLLDKLAKSDDWRAAAKLAEMLFSEKFGIGKTIIQLRDSRLDLTKLNGEEIDQLRRLLAKASGKPVEIPDLAQPKELPQNASAREAEPKKEGDG